MSRRALWSVLVTVSCAPAAPPPAPPPKVVEPPRAAKVEPPLARWLYAEEIGRANAQLEVDGGVLQVGARGRRWRLGNDGKDEVSPFLLAQELVDVRRDGKRFLFLARDGAVFVANDPLGPAIETRKGPGAGMFAFGKSATLGLDGTTLHRSTDGGATWTKVALPIPASSTPVALVSNARGEALALFHPQRVLLSSDDGATWARIPTPGIGASGLLRDAKGDLWLEGEITEKRARLGAGALSVATDPAPLVVVNKDTVKPPKTPSRVHVGDRLVEETITIDPDSKRRRIELTVSTLAGAAGPTYVLAASASPETRVRFAGYDGEVVVGLFDPDVEPRAVKLFRTKDDGKNWEPIAPPEGDGTPQFRIFAGPDTIAFSESCSKPPCAPMWLRAGKKSWQKVALPEATRPSSLHFDVARERLIVVSQEAPLTRVYAGKVSGPLTRTDFSTIDRPYATTVDPDGTLRLLYVTPSSRVERVGADGKRKPTLYLPFDTGSADLAGARGFAVVKGEAAYETSDGGEHWTNVALGMMGDVSCSTSGCTVGRAVRVGWELPDANKTLLAATLVKEGAKEPEPAPPPAEPLAVACKTTGPWKTYKGYVSPGYQHMDGDVRLLGLVSQDGATYAITLARGAAAPKQLNLVTPPSGPTPGRAVRYHSRATAAGIVAARYAYSTVASKGEDGERKYNPVDVELGWYSVATGKTQKATIAGVKPFRVGRQTHGALTAVVEGGLVFLPTRSEAPLYFVRDNGKIETMPRPTGVDDFGFEDVERVGDRLVFVQARGEGVFLTETADAGKTWTSSIWTLGEPAMLGRLGDKPALRLGVGQFGGELTGVLPFASVTPDPPDAIRFKSASLVTDKGVAHCGGKTGLRFSSNDPAVRGLRVTLPEEKETLTLDASVAYSRLTADGSLCADHIYGIDADDDREDVVLLSPADPAHGWRLRWKGLWSEKYEARPIACTLP